ncbi:hypothetical protein BV20DRAFT_949943 [Pilatotrama ljubarskyi]|nr:hypothetical protein BV20DRAFT_949943 [Pilatotrama ljubarskyi]
MSGLQSAKQQHDTPGQRSSRQKATKSASGTRRIVCKGRLQTLPDIALEIYSYLEPHDLLHLSRTCKKFRAFFLDRHLNEKLWLRARDNAAVTLPPRPPFMSEPALIHLLHSPHCHGCGAANVRKVLEGCFVRYCSKCLPLKTIRLPDANKRTHEVDRSLGTLFRYHNVARHFPVIPGAPRGRTSKYDRLLLVDVERAIKEFEALERPVTPKVVAAFERRLRERCDERRHKWLDDRENERLAALEDAKERRFEEIVSRLRSSGWEKEIDFMGEVGIATMADLPVVRQSSKLTEGGDYPSAWQKVLVAVDSFLSDIRETRLEQERRAAFQLRCDALTEAITAHYVTLPRTAIMDCRPRYIDFALTPECRTIIDVPTSQPVSAADFATVVPVVVARWNAERKRVLMDCLRPHLGEVAPDVDPLELAIATFESRWSCSVPVDRMRYPCVLVHKCDPYGLDCTHSRWLSKAEFARQDPYTRAITTLEWPEESFGDLDNPASSKVRVYSPFCTENLHTAWPVHAMRRIVSALGLDPDRTTFDELEQCEAWLRCATCEATYPKQPRFARSWRSAYRHDDRCHRNRGGQAPEWRRADGEDMKAIYAQLADRDLTDGQRRARMTHQWSCGLCINLVATDYSMADHLRETHDIRDIEEAKRDGTIYIHPCNGLLEPFDGTVCL